jgi:hypothetical protein
VVVVVVVGEEEEEGGGLAPPAKLNRWAALKLKQSLQGLHGGLDRGIPRLTTLRTSAAKITDARASAKTPLAGPPAAKFSQFSPIGNVNASANDANRGATPTTAVAKVPENVRVQAKRSLLASAPMSMGEKKAKRKKRTSTRGRCRLGRFEPKKHVWCYVDVSGRRVRECGKFVEWDLAAEGHPPKAKRTKTSETAKTAKTAKKPKV